MNKMTTPDVAGPMGRWRALAARCLNMAARGEVLPVAWQNALFVLFIAGILAYGAGFAWYMLAHFDLGNMIRPVNYDDAFYYYQIAYHLAEGRFSTFDGGITRTNGYHPLWMFVITPFYWVLDKEAALFGIKALEIMLVAGAVALLAGAARLARLPWVLLFATLPLLYKNVNVFSGMESAAALFMLGLFSLCICLCARDTARWRWALAAVAFALPWVRLEYAAISLASTAVLYIIAWSRRVSPGRAPWNAGFPCITIVPIVGAVAGPMVYFAYNRLVFGGALPVSGAFKQLLSQHGFERAGGYDFTQNFQDALQVPVFSSELLVSVEVCAYLLLVWWLVRRSEDRQDWQRLAFPVCVFGLGAGHLAMFAQNVLTVHPGLQGVFPWYFMPAHLMMALIIPIRCYVAIYLVRRLIGSRWPYAASGLNLSVILVGTILVLTRADLPVA